MKLGRTDIDIGRIAYGCWRLAEDHNQTVLTRIETALGAGMVLFDTADIYGFTGLGPDGDLTGFGAAEHILGQTFAQTPGLRQRMILATKGGIRPPAPYNSSSSYLTQALEASMQRLKTDYIDLYQVHRPDLLTGFEALAETLDQFVSSGKVRHIGVSNFAPPQIRALAAHLKTPLVSLQPEISVYETSALDNGILDICQEMSLTPLAWSPLAGGELVSSRPTEDKKLIRIRECLAQLEPIYEATASQISLAFLLAHPANIVPIIGTQTLTRIKESAQAENITLTREHWYKLLVANRDKDMP